MNDFSTIDNYVKNSEVQGLVGSVVVITNKTTGGTIGSAATTVDIASALNVNQTTASQTLTVPNPTDVTGNYRIPLNSIGSTSFTVLSTVIAPGAGILLNWTGSTWSVLGTSSGASNVTVVGGKTFTVNNTLTLAGTDGVTVTMPAVSGLTVATITGTETLTNKTLTSPVMTAPTLGVATATSYNGLTLTTTTGTFTLTNAKVLAVTATLTFSGTDSTVMTFPSTSQTIVGLTATQTLTNKTFTAPVLGAATGTSLVVTAGITSSGPTSGVGYTTGAGGTVTQITSKATGVTLNTICGNIVSHNASLAGAATVSFTFTNSAIAAGDVVTVGVKSGSSTGIYNAFIIATGAGSCQVGITNVGSTASEVVTINFAVIKAVAA